MNKLKLLLKPYLLSLLGLNRLKYSHEPRAGLKRAAILVLVPIAVIYIMLIFGAYCTLMAGALQTLGDLEAIPVGMLAVGALLTLVTSLTHGGQQLLAFRDYDIQMSLPVSPGLVAVSRLIIAYAEGLAGSLVALLPACGVYIWYARPGLAAWAVMLAVIFLSPVLPVIAGAILSALVARFSARFRGARYLRLVLSLGIIAAYLVFCFTMGSADEAQISLAILNLSSTVARLYPPAQLFARALKGDLAAFLAFAGLSLGAFGLLGLFYARGLRRLHSTVTENRAHSRFRMKRLRAASPLRALYKREFSRYISSTVYVLNTLVSPLMGLIAAIALMVMGRGKLTELVSTFVSFDIAAALLSCFMVFFLITGVTTASSISLEGGSRWILQSVPVPVLDIFRAKLLLSLTVHAPLYTVVPLLLALTLRPGALMTVLMFLIPFAASVGISELGLLLNLRLHRFDWKSEQQVIKQGAPVTILSLGGMLVSFVPPALILLFPRHAALIAASTAAAYLLLALACAVLLRKRAARGLSTL